jgi:hypothetical protein
MDKGQAENFGFNLDTIAGEAIRQREAVEAIQNLDNIFTAETSAATPLNAILGRVPEMVGIFVNGTLFSSEPTTSEISDAYESFDFEGQTFESRIVKVQVPTPERPLNTYIGGKIYLLCLVGEGQTNINRANFSHGVIRTSKDEILFFSYEGDDRGPAINIVKPLDPTEQYTVVSEFRKALGKLVP